jgi:Na+/H+ antiporter NhaD/arsenite permease-like protein
MKKIILVALILACFYAFQLFAGETPEVSHEMPLARTEQDNNARASFTGGILILAAVGVGFLAKKIYTIRSASDQ